MTFVFVLTVVIWAWTSVLIGVFFVLCCVVLCCVVLCCVFLLSHLITGLMVTSKRLHFRPFISFLLHVVIHTPRLTVKATSV